LGVIASILVVLSIETSKADLISDFQPGMVIYIQTNSQAITLTNQVTQFFTNNISFGLYHTFHVLVSDSNTNVIARVGIDRSLDGINWIVVGTNSNTALVTNGFGEQTMIGKWQWARYRCYGSNVTGNIFYMGGR
jgi:hypothetical protein